MITAKRRDKTITRNSSFFKPVNVEEERTGQKQGNPLATSPQEDSTSSTEEMVRRYPLRSSRRPPERFKDYVKYIG